MNSRALRGASSGVKAPCSWSSGPVSSDTLDTAACSVDSGLLCVIRLHRGCAVLHRPFWNAKAKTRVQEKNLRILPWQTKGTEIGKYRKFGRMIIIWICHRNSVGFVPQRFQWMLIFLQNSSSRIGKNSTLFL
jgi:hypothetical protein